MRDIIRLLPDAVANQIAAGEVIQRPASIVKELVENAVDAGATRVEVVVVDAGKTCIQVVDDGKGMSETDARLSFERHATSKIREAADLFDLHTMGFRGEALASIAAVAQVELKTRTAEQEVGTSVRIEGCRVIEQKPVACSVGANFAVRNIFFNIPARRKFLKSDQTEMTHIMAEFERLTLAHMDVTFILYNKDTVLYNLPAGPLRGRIRGLFGKRLESQLLPVSVETPLVRINGFVGTPESAKKKTAPQFFFANNRFMRHPYFAKAVQTAFDRLVPEGMQVPFFLNMEVEPSRLDVNIHPAKTEIKFQDDKPIWQILQAAVREALGKFNAIPSLDFSGTNSLSIPAFNPDVVPDRMPQIHLQPGFNPFDDHHDAPQRPTSPRMGDRWVAAAGDAFGAASPVETDRPATLAGTSRLETWPDVDTTDSIEATASDGLSPAAMSPAAMSPAAISPAALTPATLTPAAISSADTVISSTLAGEEPVPTPLPFDESMEQQLPNICCQYMGQYILATSERGVHLINQHLAHCRVLYDQYLQQISSRKGVSQGLLFPAEMELSPAQENEFQKLRSGFQNAGFDVHPVEGKVGCYTINGIPAGTEGLDPVNFLREMIDEAHESPTALDAVGRHIALMMARRAALPIGLALSRDEMKALVSSLYASQNPNYTPDGRIIQAVITPHRIDALFH